MHIPYWYNQKFYEHTKTSLFHDATAKFIKFMQTKDKDNYEVYKSIFLH